METSDNSEVLPSKFDPLLPVSISNPNHEVGVSLNTINALPQSKSKILYESVASVNPLDEGVIHAADVEDAFRVAYVDFHGTLWKSSKNFSSINLRNNYSKFSLISPLSNSNKQGR